MSAQTLQCGKNGSMTGMKTYFTALTLCILGQKNRGNTFASGLNL